MPIDSDAVAMIRGMAPVQIIWGGNLLRSSSYQVAACLGQKNNAGRDFADFGDGVDKSRHGCAALHFSPMNMDGKLHPTQKAYSSHAVVPRFHPRTPHHPRSVHGLRRPASPA